MVSGLGLFFVVRINVLSLIFVVVVESNEVSRMGFVFCFLDWLWLCRWFEEFLGCLMLWIEYWMGGCLIIDGGSFLVCFRRG